MSGGSSSYLAAILAGTSIPVAVVGANVSAAASQVPWEKYGLATIVGMVLVWGATKFLPAERDHTRKVIQDLVDGFAAQRERDREAAKRKDEQVDKMVRAVLVALTKAGVDVDPDG